jgi:RimJ/RimL family protein N-acetyltransferase
VAAEHRGNRYGAEAVRMLSRWGFDAGIERIELECDVRNAASAGTALAAGFRYEGTLRDRLSEPGRDAALFARVAGDSGDPIPAQFPRLAEPGLSDGTVTLRTLDTGDMEEFAEQEQDPLTIATGFSGNVPPPAELARTCARAALDWLVGPLARFALVDEATGAFAGSVQLRLAGPPQVAGVGYAVHPAFRGRGYTARALQLLVPWAFDVAGFARLELGAKAWNVASQRAALRAGFEPDGVRAARLRNPDGSFSDEVRFALVNPAIRRD